LPAQYEIVLSKQASKYYKKVPIKIAKRIDRAFLILENDPFDGGDIKILAGKIKRYRIRVGNIRIIYQVNSPQKRVEVSAILPRGEVYKKINL